MSLRGIFVKNYRGVPHFNTDVEEMTTDDWQRCLRRLRRMPEEAQQNCRVFKGHMPFGLHEHLPGPCEYITFLRDPVRRVISHYRMQLRKKQVPADLKLDPGQPDWNLGPYPILARSFDNAQTRLLSGADLELPFGGCTEEHLRIAKANLERHFIFVGLTERFDLSLLLLRRICGWNWRYYVPDNLTPGSPIQLAPELLESIRELNRFDYELYRYAEERFQQTVDRYGWRLRVEQPAYAVGNYLHQRLHAWRHAFKRTLQIEQRESMISAPEPQAAENRARMNLLENPSVRAMAGQAKSGG